MDTQLSYGDCGAILDTLLPYGLLTDAANDAALSVEAFMSAIGIPATMPRFTTSMIRSWIEDQ